VRGRESVVDVISRRARPSPWPGPDRSSPRREWKRVFSRMADIAGQHGRDRPLRLGPWQSSMKRTGGRVSVQRQHQLRSRHVGRSRPWAAEMRQQQDDRAAVASSSTVGSIARSRVSSVTPAPSIGTLRSTRTSALAGQVSGRSSRVLNDVMTSDQRAIAPAVSTMRFEKPHSLSYQLTTRTSLPSSTAVSRLSTVELAGCG
jgi:hypothetical protein